MATSALRAIGDGDMKYAFILLLLCGLVLAEPGYTRIRGMWVSDQVCRSDPAFCGMPANIIMVNPKPDIVQLNGTAPNITFNISAKPAEQNRTLANCTSAREKDWRIYGSIMASNNFYIDIWHVSDANKRMILDNMAKGRQSSQARCLRGETW